MFIRGRCRLHVLLLWAGLTHVGQVWAQIDLDTALLGHESTIGALIAFDMRLDVYAPSPSIARQLAAVARGADVELAHYQTYWWLVDGRRERVQVSPVVLGDADIRSDLVRDGSVDKQILNWDWKNPPQLSPAKQGRIRAEIRAQSPIFPGRDPALFALRYPRFEPHEPRLTLRQFINRFRERSVIDADDFEITLRGDRLEFYKDDEQVRLWLSKSHGFLIRRMVREKIVPIAVHEHGKQWQRLQYEVQDFQKIGESHIPFPKVVRYSLFDAFRGDEVSYAIHMFTCHSANVPIRPELFDLQFPKNVLVVDTWEDPTKVKWYLLGEGGKRIPIRSRDELALYEPRQPASRGGSQWMIALHGVVLVLMVVALLWRKRRRRET